MQGFPLYVNLGASQVRRRLKGHGFGVRRVETAGAGRALIVHTATGEHLRQLEALFADVIERPTPVNEPEPALGRSLANLRNIDPATAAWLRDVGVQCEADLRRFGPVFAYGLVKQRQPNCPPDLLWMLAGALADVDWRELPTEEKERLRREAGES